jgi:diguanylate cyclase (GGDEF)-like protein/PAS domain S-box-containing protein
LAVVAGGFVGTVGVCAIVGWCLDIETLKRLAPSLPTLKFNTACCFVLLGISIALGAGSRFARVTAVVVAALATASIAEYATGWSLGIDQTFFRDAAGGSRYPGRMALTAALCLIFAATGLLAIRRGRDRLVTWLAMSMLTVGWLGSLGYLFGVRGLYTVGALSPMAAPTAVTFVILGVGLLASSPRGPLPWIVRGDDPGAVVMRIVLPLALVGLPVAGELRLAGQHAGWYGTEFGVAIMVMVASISITTIVMFGARLVNRSHAARVLAHDQLSDLNADLEARIAERTTELAKSQTWALTLAGSAPIGIFHSDSQGRRTYVNDRVCEIYGISREAAMAAAIGSGIHDEDRDRVVADWAAGVAAGVDFDSEFRVVQPTGRVLWVRAHSAPVRGASDADSGNVGTVADVTASHDVAVALRDTEELFRTSFESSPVGIALVNGYGRIVRANRALCELTDHSTNELLMMRAQALLEPEAVEDEGTRQRPDDADRRVIRRDGSVRWASIRYAAIGNEPTSADALTIAQFVDTTERRRFEDRLAQMANHDPLTGLMNRRSFETALEAHVAHCKRYGPAGAVLMLDLDHFKRINDDYGHNVGDQVIVMTGDRLRQRLRESDVIARLGGDEFVVLLPVGGGADARAVAQGLVEAIHADAPAIADGLVRLSASIGIALFDEAEHSPAQMLVDADLAMYEAKEAGRDRWVEHVVLREQGHLTKI